VRLTLSAMMRALVLLLALACAAAQAQEAPRPGRGMQGPPQGPQPREQARAQRDGLQRGTEARGPHRFTREEREKLRQDVIDANREMRGHRK